MKTVVALFDINPLTMWVGRVKHNIEGLPCPVCQEDPQ